MRDGDRSAIALPEKGKTETRILRYVALLFTLAIAIAQAVAISIGTSISSSAGEVSFQRSRSCSALTRSVMLSQLLRAATKQLGKIWALGAIAHPLSRGDRGGKPIYINLFTQEAKRVLITGISGSGKSVLGWRFALEVLEQNIPVVGMDISSGSR